MTKTFFLCAALVSVLVARENPFFTHDESHLPITSNIPDTLPKLTTIPYNFPNQARVLKEVSFTIQNLDGSIETRTMTIEKSIDWHTPITLSQASRSGSADKPSSVVAQSAVADFGFIRFDTKGKHLTIKSNDPMIRHFSLTEPNRIIVDFNRNEIFTIKEKILNAPPYTSVNISNQGKFIRATIVLDGRYDYSLTKNSGIISINCR
jgi:hypothetical protein